MNYIRFINVVKNAVHQDEVEAFSAFICKPGYIRNNKPTSVTLACIIDVPLVEIDPQVVAVYKVARIGSRSATYIQHLANLGHIVVTKKEARASCWQKGLAIVGTRLEGQGLHQPSSFFPPYLKAADFYPVRKKEIDLLLEIW